MTTQANGPMFTSRCPCGWHVSSSSKQTAVELMRGHRCKEKES